MLDGNPGTMWHTQFMPTAPALPHSITIDMHATNTVSGLRYRPRTSGVSTLSSRRVIMQLISELRRLTPEIHATRRDGP